MTFEDGVVLFNPENSSTVLYHPMLQQLKCIIMQSQFNLDSCLEAVGSHNRQLIMDTLDSLIELGFIHRISH